MNSIAICEDDSFTLEKLEEMARCYVRSKGLHADICIGRGADAGAGGV